MEYLQHQVDLTKDQFAFNLSKPLSNLLLTFLVADFLHSSESERAGMVGARTIANIMMYDVCFSTGQRFRVDLDDLWSIYA